MLRREDCISTGECELTHLFPPPAALGEPDVFPAADLVLQRVASSTDEPLSASALEARAEAWRPWRG